MGIIIWAAKWWKMRGSKTDEPRIVNYYSSVWNMTHIEQLMSYLSFCLLLVYLHGS